MIKVETLNGLLQYAVSRKASDLHISDGMCPAIRVNNELEIISDSPITNDQMFKLLREYLSEERLKIFEKEREHDCSFGIPNLGRFRANLFYYRNSVGCAIRVLPFESMTFEQIGFPAAIAQDLTLRNSGLILVTGATGSGKTTTLVSMLDHINKNQKRHIVTIEDPIEFVFKNNKSIIHQREIGADSHSFPKALKHVLRQDPNVIMIGEMRDLEAVEAALTVAETGHLVFATLHTPSAAQSVNRIIDVFPAHQQQQVRVQLSFVLQAVICQRLIPKISEGLALAAEIMLVNQPIRNLIRESKSQQIYSAIQMGQKEGMRTLNMSLAELVKANKIKRESAIAQSPDVQELESLCALK